MSKIKIKIIIILLGLFFLTGKAQAVTVTNGDFQLTSDNPLFNVTNAVPGGEYSSDFTVTNIGTTAQNLQMQLAITADPVALENYLYLKIINKNTSECLLGCTPVWKIKDANGTELTFNGIGPGETKNYSFILDFNVNAGNEFQNAKMTFDLTLGYQGITPSVVTHHHNGGGGGGGGGGAGAITPIGFAGVAGAAGGATAGAVTGPGEQPGGGEGVSPQVAGEVTACKSWPLWVWVLALIIFALNFWRNARKNYKNEKYKWIYPLVWTVIAVVFWYYFDKCREFRWFLYGSIIIAIASHFVYMYYLRKKIKKGMPVEKEEESVKQ